jgi:hypothetical protein
MSDEGQFHLSYTDVFTGELAVLTLPAAYGPPTGKMERYEKGIRVTAPGQLDLYVNGKTRQVSTNPEICRSELILDPGAFDVGRYPDPKLIKSATKIYGRNPRNRRA